jgi:hypothetical protein
MRNDIPSDSASNFGARVRETLMTYLGKQGDPLDRGLTIRDLVDSGFASLSNFKFGGGSAPLIAGPSITDAYVPDLTPPPTPTGFTASAAISNIIIECDAPIYTQGHGHRLSRIYGATRASGAAQPVFAAAVEITQFAGQVTSYATNPATEWHLWIKWESIDGVLSASPAGGTNGFVVTTGQDVAKLLAALTGQLTADQLYVDLGTRISLIDAAANVAGSVNARVATVQAQVNDIQNTPAYANGTTYAFNDLVTYNGAIYQAKSTTTGNLPTNTTYWNKVGDYTSLGQVVAAHTTQISTVVSDLSAEVTLRQTLNSQVNDATTGLPATRSTLIANYYTKTAADSAISAATTTLVSTTALNSALGNYTTTAGLVADYYTKTATDSAISSATSVLVSTTALNSALTAYTNTATLTANYYTKTAADTAISQATSALVSTTALNSALTAYTNTATLNTLYYTKTGADSAISAATSNLVSTTALNTALGSYTTTASLTTNYYTKTQADSAISSATTNLVSTSGLATTLGNYPTNATLTTNHYTKTATDSAISSATSTLVSTSTLSGYTTTAALEANYFTKASGTSLEGKFAIKVDLNGYVSGFGLASTANNAGATSTFAVRSDAFYIASPSGPGVAPTMPFIVRTTETTIGGVTVPVGVYITDGYIQNGTITNAKIANLAVDSAKIASLSADKIIAGSISVGQYIQSSNYVAGSAGWKINGDGAAEFGSASIRGQLVASQINSAGLSIKAADGTVILSAGSSVGASAFTGNVTGSVAGTAASTVVSTANSAASAASTAQSTANSAASAASSAQTTATAASTAASNAQSTANTANSTANTANSTANSAVSAAATAQAAADAKLAKSGAQILTGPVTLNAASAITVGTPALNGAAGANGFYIGSTGIVGTQNGLTTFALDNAGNATFKGNLTGASGTFGGNLAVGSSPAISGTTMSGSGAIINSGGTFAIGSSTANITFTGGALRLNGNVVDIENLIPGAALPNYVRTYKGNVSPTLNVGTLASNTAWGPLAMDATALNNKLGATDYDAYRTLFPAGTYFYELSVPVKNNTSDTNDATYTALVVNPPGGVGGSMQDVEVGYDYENNTPIYQSQFVSNPYTVISTAGVNVVGDWQTATIFGVGRFTLASPTYISAAVMTTEANNMNVVARTGFCTLIWRVWRAD